MTEKEINEILVRRYSRTQSPLGRWRLNLYARWKTVSWRWLLASTHFLKRSVDLFSSAIFLIAFSPFLFLLALLIKIEDGGPVFFVQTRVGWWGREFKMYKFRSMCMNAEQQLQQLMSLNQHANGVTFKIKKDPRITKIGYWLRKFSLDELPQFYNVLKGDMSLVGPRPPLPREVALYSAADRRRLAVTPGLTCLWQIGGRAELDFPEQVQLDVRYIESQSFWMDMKILIKTIPAVLLGRGAC